jgi:photosystem II stability/assembly factor-like uncharacterized protein
VSQVTLLVGTRKGLFRASSTAERENWQLEGPFIEGYEVYHAILDPRDEAAGYAGANHIVWGSHVYRTGDGGSSWEPTAGRPAFPADSGSELKAIWHVAPGPADQPATLFAGVEPAALFVSPDRGANWEWNAALGSHATRSTWQPAKGGLALHSILADPRDSKRMYVSLSAGGTYRTDDGGSAWKPVNRGVRADFLPDRYPETGQCVHAVRLHPRRPDRLYQQNHCGTYRTDDRAGAWEEISGGLPSDFGYVIGLDPRDPDRAWTIPEASSHMRSVCDARLRVYETLDAGRSWQERSEGLPQAHAYVSILREALDTDGLDPCGVYFGTSTGHLYGSRDGREWSLIGAHLPKILSVTATASG